MYSCAILLAFASNHLFQIITNNKWKGIRCFLGMGSSICCDYYNQVELVKKDDFAHALKHLGGAKLRYLFAECRHYGLSGMLYTYLLPNINLSSPISNRHDPASDFKRASFKHHPLFFHLLFRLL
jgi:hypothetical protein